MFLIFLGPPGSGKGTQAQHLVRNHGYVHISTGELLREQVANGGPLAEQIDVKLKSGEFVPDEIIFYLIKSFVSERVDSNLIFDGFPRNQKQAELLDLLLEAEKQKVSLVIDFSVSLERLVDRVKGRYNCSDCGTVYHEVNKRPKFDGVCDLCGGSHFKWRSDDTVEVMKTRVKVYQEETEQLKAFYDQKGILKTIDASLDPLKVQVEIEECLKQVGIII